jgi:hypothetical protein
MNEARQFVFYYDHSNQDPNPAGHELNSVQDPTVTAIDTTIVIYPMLDQGNDQVVVDSYVRTVTVERKSKVVVTSGTRINRCMNEIRLGAQRELLKDINISIGVAENEATNIKLIMTIRLAILVLLLMNVYLFLISIRKAK